MKEIRPSQRAQSRYRGTIKENSDRDGSSDRPRNGSRDRSRDKNNQIRLTTKKQKIDYFMGKQLYEGALRINQIDGTDQYKPQIQKNKNKRFFQFWTPRLKNINKGNRQGYLPFVQFEIDVLDCDQKEQFPHQILYSTFNLRPQNTYKDKQKQLPKYIPGNFLHRQFSYYFRHYNFEFTNKNKFQIETIKIGRQQPMQNLRRFNQILNNFPIYKDRCRLIQIQIYQIAQNIQSLHRLKNDRMDDQHYNLHLKYKQSCNKIKKQYNELYQSINGQEFRTRLKTGWENIVQILSMFLRNAGQLIEQKFRLREKIQQQYRKDLKQKSRQLLNLNDQLTQNQITNYKNFHQQFQNKARSYLCKQKRSQMQRWFNNVWPDIKYITRDQKNQNKYQKFRPPNLAIGRLSYIYQKQGKDKMVGFSPFVYPQGSGHEDPHKIQNSLNTRLKKQKQNWIRHANNAKIKEDHPQRQILRLAKIILYDLLENKEKIQEYKNLREAKYFVIDILSQRSFCQPQNLQQLNKECSHQIPIYRCNQLETVLTQFDLHVGIYLRVSFNQPNHPYRENQSEVHQTKQKGRWANGSYVGHLIQLTDDCDGMIQYLFKPEHIFISSKQSYVYKTYYSQNQSNQIRSNLQQMVQVIQ